MHDDTLRQKSRDFWRLHPNMVRRSPPSAIPPEVFVSEDEKRLLSRLKNRCLKHGKFTLASGQESDYYLDVRLASVSHEAADWIGWVLFQRLRALNLHAIGGPETGAIPIVTATAIAWKPEYGEAVPEGFWVRSRPKDHGSMNLIEGNLTAGSRVALVDDVATSGHSLMRAVEAVRARDCEVVCVVPLVDRLAGAAEMFAKAGIRYKPVYTIMDFGVEP